MPLEEQPKDAAEHLADETGRPVSDFEPDLESYPYPDLEELEWRSLSDDESPFTDS